MGDNFTIDNEKLIELVEARPALYDKKLKSYSDRIIKDKMWRQIYECLIEGWTNLDIKEKTQIVHSITLKLLRDEPNIFSFFYFFAFWTK